MAYAHTHPNQDGFRVNDTPYADQMGVDAYVVNPDMTIDKYSHTSEKIFYGISTVSPIPVMPSYMEKLDAAKYNAFKSHIMLDHGVCTQRSAELKWIQEYNGETQADWYIKY